MGIVLSQVPACFSMAESTILLLAGSKLVIECLELLLRELLGEGVLELERDGSLSRNVHLGESTIHSPLVLFRQGLVMLWDLGNLS